MASRLELQAKLEELLGSKNVYYQPPETVKMAYPAIRYSKGRIETKKAGDSTYSKSRIETRKAEDSIYLKNTRYEVIVIDPRPDNPVIDKLLELPHCSYDRHYKSDNLNHDALTLYY